MKKNKKNIFRQIGEKKWIVNGKEKITGLWTKIKAGLKKFAEKKWVRPFARFFGGTFKLIGKTFGSFMEHRVMKMGAALSYYTVFSLPAMLVILISLCSFFFGQEIVEGKVFGLMNEYVGSHTALQMQQVLKQIALKGANTWATIIGIVTLVFSASGIFGEIQDSLNYIWGLKAKPKKGFILLLLNRLASFSMLLVLAFILLISLLLTSLMDLFFNHLQERFSGRFVEVITILNNVVVLLAVSVLFMLLFKVLPDGKVPWKDAFIGALVTAILFMIGKYLISIYLTDNPTVTAYGGTASIVILLIWVYYSSLILYFGAEFTQSFSAFKGRKIEPNKYSVKIEAVEIEKPAPKKR